MFELAGLLNADRMGSVGSEIKEPDYGRGDFKKPFTA
jgi:hypothetical protein